MRHSIISAPTTHGSCQAASRRWCFTHLVPEAVRDERARRPLVEVVVMRAEPTRSPLVTRSRSSSVKVVLVGRSSGCLVAGIRRLPTAVVVEAEVAGAVATVLNGMARAADDLPCDFRTAPKSSPLQVAAAERTDRQDGQAEERLAAGPHLVEPRLRVVAEEAAGTACPGQPEPNSSVETVKTRAAAVAAATTEVAVVETTSEAVEVQVTSQH